MGILIYLKMSSKDKALGSLLLIGIIILITIYLWIQLQIIYLARFLFWFDIVIIPLSIIGAIIVGIIIIKGEWDFEEIIEIIIPCVLGFLLIFSLLSINWAYNNGYSDETFQREAELKQQIQEWTYIRGLVTGELAYQLTYETLDEAIDSMCQDPNFPCQETKRSYELYKVSLKWKGRADNIAQVLNIIKE